MLHFGRHANGRVIAPPLPTPGYATVHTHCKSIIILNFLSKRKSNLYTTQKYFCFKILFNPSSPIFDPNLHAKNLKKYNSKTNCPVYTHCLSIVILNFLSKRKNNFYTTQEYFCFKILFNPSSPIFDPQFTPQKFKKNYQNTIFYQN